MKFIIKRAVNKEWFFIITAKNGQTLATSETYKRRGGCLKAIKSIVNHCAEAVVIDFQI
jgi:uncharacterized protein YegP (UPF0339 family)